MAVSTRMARALSAAAIAAMLVPAGALAAPPTHSVSPNLPIEFPAGTVCADTIRFENLSLNAKDTAFAAGPSGSQRILTRGSGVSRVTNLDTGATYDMRGGFRIQLTFGADGSLRADATGTDFIAYYFAGRPVRDRRRAVPGVRPSHRVVRAGRLVPRQRRPRQRREPLRRPRRLATPA